MRDAIHLMHLSKVAERLHPVRGCARSAANKNLASVVYPH